jgi:AcrR family transcriptional regulator
MATYHHGHLRSTVLAAAGELIEQEGLAGLSVREAARRAAVSHNAPYRHFPDRESLLAALAAEGFDRLEQALEGRTGRALGAAYLRFALAHPERFRLMFATRPAQPTYERFVQAFSATGADARLAGAAAWSLVHGLACLALDRQLPGDEEFAGKVLGAMRFAQRSA